MKKFKQAFSLVMRIGVSIALMAFLFTKIDAGQVLSVARGANKPLLALALALTLSINIICYFRWKMLLNAVGVHPREKKLISSYCGGIFYNVFLPSTVGGDFVRGFDLAQGTQKSHEVAATVIVDRLSGFAGMMIVALTGVLMGISVMDDRRILYGISGLTAGLGLVLVALFNDGIYTRVNAMLGSRGGRIRRALQGVHEHVYSFRGEKSLIARNLGLSVVIQLIAPISSYVIALAMGLDVHLAYFLVFLPVVTAISALPISTGGIGIRDALMVLFLAKVGVARNAAFALSLIGFSFVVLVALAGGVIYVLTLHPRRV